MMWFTPPSAAAVILTITLWLAAQNTAAATAPENLSSYLAAHPISTQAAVPSSRKNTTAFRTIPPSVVNLAASSCPASCDDSGLNPNNWTVYHHVNRLSRCDKTLILNFALYNPLDDPRTHSTIRSCAADFAPSTTSSTSDAPSPPGHGQTQVQEPLQIASNKSSTIGSIDDFTAASQQISSFLAQQRSTNETIAFAYSGSVAVGIFAGSKIQSQGILATVLQKFISEVESSGFSESVLVQLCANSTRSSRYGLGIIANANADVGYVQSAVATWASGGCVTTYDNEDVWQNVTLTVPSWTNYTSSNTTHVAKQAARALSPRSDCSTITVASGDSCKYSKSPGITKPSLIFVLQARLWQQNVVFLGPILPHSTPAVHYVQLLLLENTFVAHLAHSLISHLVPMLMAHVQLTLWRLMTAALRLLQHLVLPLTS